MKLSNIYPIVIVFDRYELILPGTRFKVNLGPFWTVPKINLVNIFKITHDTVHCKNNVDWRLNERNLRWIKITIQDKAFLKIKIMPVAVSRT